jgi:hypothetical protein
MDRGEEKFPEDGIMAIGCYRNIWIRELKPAEWFPWGSKTWLQRPNFPADSSRAGDYFQFADFPDKSVSLSGHGNSQQQKGDRKVLAGIFAVNH